MHKNEFVEEKLSSVQSLKTKKYYTNIKVEQEVKMIYFKNDVHC